MLSLKSPPSLGGGSSGNKSWAKSRADPATICCSSTDLLNSSISVCLTMIDQGVNKFPWNTHAKGDKGRETRGEIRGSRLSKNYPRLLLLISVLVIRSIPPMTPYLCRFVISLGWVPKVCTLLRWRSLSNRGGRAMIL